ncbi:MAG: aminotransferase class V-fold PLP-dependent enzyme [Pseudomonadota bacterium]
MSADDGRWREVRAEFPVLERCAYLNTGTYGPLPRRAIAAQSAQFELELTEGRAGSAYDAKIFAERDGLRAELAEVIGAQSDDICLTRATTEGINIVLGGLGLGPGDQVVTSDLEHRTLMTALEASGAQLRIAKLADAPYAEIVQRVADQVGPRTKLIALSHVDWAAGRVLPIPAISRLEPPLLVDGAQSVGAIPLDVGALGCDFLVFPGQKWLVGPDSSGALYVKADRQNLLATTMASNYGHQVMADGTIAPFPGAARLQPGPLAIPSVVALRASLSLARELGFARFERARGLTEQFAEALGARYKVIPCTERATLIAVVPPIEAARAAVQLSEQAVLVRTIPDEGWLRVSVGYWNDENDLERLLAGLEKLS